MMATTLEQRITTLEHRHGATQRGPDYVTVATVEEIPAAVARAGRPVKVYVGWGPDEWDEPDELAN